MFCIHWISILEYSVIIWIGEYSNNIWTVYGDAYRPTLTRHQYKDPNAPCEFTQYSDQILLPNPAADFAILTKNVLQHLTKPGQGLAWFPTKWCRQVLAWFPTKWCRWDKIPLRGCSMTFVSPLPLSWFYIYNIPVLWIILCCFVNVSNRMWIYYFSYTMRRSYEVFVNFA